MMAKTRAPCSTTSDTKTSSTPPLSHGGVALFRLSFRIPPCDDPVELFEVSLRLPILGLLLARPAAVPVNEVGQVAGAQYDEERFHVHDCIPLALVPWDQPGGTWAPHWGLLAFVAIAALYGLR
jgi:hypothetical protein